MPRSLTLLGVGLALLGCTVAARLPSALHDPLWEDEVGVEHAITAPTLARSLRQIVTHESTPPAYYVIARTVDVVAVRLTLGPESRVTVLRTLSLLFSLGCTALTFLLASRLLSLWRAVMAGLLASFAAVLVVHGSEIRAYPLLALVSVAFALVLDDAVAEPTAPRLALLAVVVALGSLTHYFFLFTLGAGALWALLLESGRSSRRRVGVAILIGLIPLAAWSPAWLHQYGHGIFATAPPFSLERFGEVVPSLFAPQAIVNDLGTLVRASATVAVLVSAVLLLRRRDGRLVALLTLVPLVAASLLAWTTGDRIFDTRNLIEVAPFAAIAMVWACTSLPSRALSLALGGFVVALVVATFAYGQMSLGRTPYDRIADDLRAQGYRGDEPVVWFGDDGGIGPVAWYLAIHDGSNIWPRYVLSRPTSASCRALEVVARTRVGRRWLRGHREAVLETTSVPSFGDAPEGKRRADIVVARLRWTGGILTFRRSTRQPLILHLAGTRSPCLRP